MCVAVEAGFLFFQNSKKQEQKGGELPQVRIGGGTPFFRNRHLLEKDTTPEN